MPRKHYKDALIEAAASGAEPERELRAHLAGCADCRAAFEQERSLFASIDAGLHVTANAEVPGSLLARVRASLDEESAPRRIWATNWLVLASAAVVVAAFFSARALWRPSIVHQSVESAGNPVVPPLATTPSQNHAPVFGPTVEKNSASQRHDVVAKLPPWHEAQARGKITPEVLVPRDQEILLTEFAVQWSLHKHPLLLAQEFDATILSPLQVVPIQIDELGVKLLAEENFQ
jgi:hypothetical protein